MKIDGKKVEQSNVETLVLKRPSGNIAFEARAVLDMTDFDKLCPPPKAPTKIVKGGQRIQDVESPIYKKAFDSYQNKRLTYMILKSLEATPNLEWETVDMSDHTTWSNYENELKDAGFSQIEVMRIVRTVMKANSLDEADLEEARNDFLALKRLKEEEGEKDTSQSGENISTESGELANVSV